MKNENYERGINLTVRDLRDCLEGLPDDMDVIIALCDEQDTNVILGYRHIRTVGVLESQYEPKQALCVAASENGADMYTLMNLNNNGSKCVTQLF